MIGLKNEKTSGLVRSLCRYQVLAIFRYSLPLSLFSPWCLKKQIRVIKCHGLSFQKVQMFERCSVKTYIIREETPMLKYAHLTLSEFPWQENYHFCCRSEPNPSYPRKAASGYMVPFSRYPCHSMNLLAQTMSQHFARSRKRLEATTAIRKKGAHERHRRSMQNYRILKVSTASEHPENRKKLPNFMS